MDFEGRAKPENLAKINYYKQLNERAFLKRKLIRNGNLATPQNKIQVGVNAPGGIRMISHLDVMNKIAILDHLKFSDWNLKTTILDDVVLSMKMVNWT